MTKEEKKAIETLQYLCSDDCVNKDIIKIIVNLIEKLQKENEELKKSKDNIQVVYGGRNYGKTNSIVKEYISKDKIREKIKELEEYIVKIEEETCGRCITIGEDMCIRYLKELLEEG